jgi:hypothetical protein
VPSEYSKFMRQERARLEREEEERRERLAEKRAQEDRERFGPELLARSPIKIAVVYTKGTHGFRAEAFGLGLAFESPSSRESAKQGLITMIRRQARTHPRQVLEILRRELSAEELNVDLMKRGPRARRATGSARQ